MRLVHDGQRIEYHVIRWRNSAFHNHDYDGMEKRKLLGGVSFDSGAGSAGRKSGNDMTQAGVQEAQPSFSNAYESNPAYNAAGTGVGNITGKEGSGNGGTKDLKAIKGEAAENKEIEKHDNIVYTAVSIFGSMITCLIRSGVEKDVGNPVLSRAAHKLENGIRTLLGKSGRDFEKQRRHRQKKRLPSGTRPITKEDVYEIQVNSSYLLDSYNKKGERSTLGK